MTKILIFLKSQNKKNFFKKSSKILIFFNLKNKKNFFKNRPKF